MSNFCAVCQREKFLSGRSANTRWYPNCRHHDDRAESAPQSTNMPHVQSTMPHAQSTMPPTKSTNMPSAQSTMPPTQSIKHKQHHATCAEHHATETPKATLQGIMCRAPPHKAPCAKHLRYNSVLRCTEHQLHAQSTNHIQRAPCRKHLPCA